MDFQQEFNLESAYEALRDENSKLRQENERLRLQLQLLNPDLTQGNNLAYKVDIPNPPLARLSPHPNSTSRSTTSGISTNSNPHAEFLSNPEIRRYGRQLILPIVGIQGQKKLKASKILIIGAGGLGSPAGLYLAAAGVGKLGFVDHDLVDASNLHRQIIHTETREGLSKALSAQAAIRNINSFCDCRAYPDLLSSSNALELIQEYDIVLDCTDNVATRYLINDACVLLGKPLVSGSALRLHGQLLLYNLKGGPCYRCLYPSPPPPETVTNCSDGGVIGAVTGVIGSLQAMEAIKIVLGVYQEGYQPTMIMYSADRNPSFHTIKLRGRQANCDVCGDNPTVTELQDYVQFCGSTPIDKTPNLYLLGSSQRISCQGYKDWIELHGSTLPHILLDVRDSIQFEICQLPNSLNIPIKDLTSRYAELEQTIRMLTVNLHSSGLNGSSNKAPRLAKPTIFVVCRLGNDSQVAVRMLQGYFDQADPLLKPESIMDLSGGLYSWSKQVDDQFPIY